MFQITHFRFLRLSAITLTILLSIGCAKTLRIYGADLKQEKGHQVTEIMDMGSREEILGIKELHDALSAAGVTSEDIKDGSVAVGRNFCCGGEGTVETEAPAWIYVPPSMSVERGDIVEFVVGAGPNGPANQRLNTAIRVRHKNGINTNECRWEPDNPALWMRVIYCPWMEDEGWIKGSGLNPVWYKEAN